MIRCVLLLVIVVCGGCTGLPRHGGHRAQAPPAFQAPPTAEQLIARLNHQSAQVHQLQAYVRVAMDNLPALNGNLTVERPKRMRLDARLLSFSEMGVDVGSNDYAFWIWTRYSEPGQPQALYYAHHEDYEHSQIRQTLAIEPQWVIDAMGMVEFDPAHLISGPISRPDGLVELNFAIPTAGGSMGRKVVVDPTYGWIYQQAFYDSAWRLRAYVTAYKHQYYPEVQVSLPHRIELTVQGPDGQKASLNLTTNRYTLNALYADPEVLWRMPDPPGVQKIDLTRVPAEPLAQAMSGGMQVYEEQRRENVGQRAFQALRDRRPWR